MKNKSSKNPWIVRVESMPHEKEYLLNGRIISIQSGGKSIGQIRDYVHQLQMDLFLHLEDKLEFAYLSYNKRHEKYPLRCDSTNNRITSHWTGPRLEAVKVESLRIEGDTVFWKELGKKHSHKALNSFL